MSPIDLSVMKLLYMTNKVKELPSVQRSVDRIFKAMISAVDFTYPKIDWTKAISQECR